MDSLHSIKESWTNDTVGDLLAAVDCTPVSLALAASTSLTVERDSALGTSVKVSPVAWTKFKPPDVLFSARSASRTASLSMLIPDQSSHVVEAFELRWRSVLICSVSSDTSVRPDFRLRVVLATTGTADDDETLAVLRRQPRPNEGELAVTFLLITDATASDEEDRSLHRAVFCTVDSRQRDLFRPAVAAVNGRE